jgi:hypothetical protein
MKQRKVWQLWTALSPLERRDFLPWIDMKLRGGEAYVRSMVQLFYQRGTIAPSEADIWQHLYPMLPYDDARLRKLWGQLGAWLEQYLSVLAFEADPPQQSLYLLRSLLDRDQPSLFLKAYRRDTHAEQHRRYPYEKSLLYQRYQVKYQPKARHQSQRPTLRAIDRWWSLERMELLCGMPHDSVMEDDPRAVPGLLPDEAVVSLLERHLDPAQAPEVALYLRIFRLLNPAGEGHQKDANLQAIEDLLAQIEGEPPVSTLALMLNHYLRAYTQRGQPEDARLAINLARMGLKMGWLLVDGSLPWDRLRNLINLCLQNQDLAQAEVLLDTYLPLVPSEQREEAELFHRGNLDFAREAYPAVIQRLGSRRFSNPLYEVQARSQVLMSHYLLDQSDPVWLADQIGQLMRYLRAQAFSQAFKAAYRNQLRFLRRLLLAHRVEALLKLQTEIEETRPLNRAPWLADEVARKLIQMGHL